MKIGYVVRNGINYNYKLSAGFMCCSNAYACKDILKTMGFVWNSCNRSWDKIVDVNDFWTLFVDVVVNCDMTAADAEASMGRLPEYLLAKEIPESATEKYNAYMDAHPEWFLD